MTKSGARMETPFPQLLQGTGLRGAFFRYNFTSSRLIFLFLRELIYSVMLFWCLEHTNKHKHMHCEAHHMHSTQWCRKAGKNKINSRPPNQRDERCNCCVLCHVQRWGGSSSSGYSRDFRNGPWVAVKNIYMRAEKLLAQNNNDVVVTMQLALLPPPPSVSSELASNDNAMRAIVSDYLQRGLERRRRRV